MRFFALATEKGLKIKYNFLVLDLKQYLMREGYVCSKEWTLVGLFFWQCDYR